MSAVREPNPGETARHGAAPHAQPAPAGLALDPPLFDPVAFRLSPDEAALADRARALGQTIFAARAERYDREASFPTENYRDLHRAGLLGVCIPKCNGGLGADYRAYSIAAAEIGRYCGATALTWNMHVCSTLWSGALADDLDMTAAQRAEHYDREASFPTENYRDLHRAGLLSMDCPPQVRMARRARSFEVSITVYCAA